MLNSKKNQSCWNCDHFQRFTEKMEDADILCGQCRREPRFGEIQLTAGPLVLLTFPYIQNGRDFWCAQWQKSVLPVPSISQFQHSCEFPTTWLEWKPWNRKAVANISCWNCNHFQRNEEVVNGNGNLGQCRKLPPPAAVITDQPDYGQGQKHDFEGPTSWCGMWEKNQEEVPAPTERRSKSIAERFTPDYETMTKTELLELANSKGLEVTSSNTKAEIIAALTA